MRGLLTVGVALVAVAGGVFALVRPELIYRSVVKKYPAGTPAEVVIRDHGGRIYLKPSWKVLPYEPREDEKRSMPFYEVYLPAENVYVQFNYYKEVIRVIKPENAFTRALRRVGL